MANPRPIFLGLFDTKDIFKVQTLSPGVYEREIRVQGNSILSSVYYKSGTGTITVEWYDTTLGREDGEVYTLQNHLPISAPTTNRITVTSLHDKPVCRVTITGGDVEFGVYVTVVNSFASDLDAALKFHDSIVNLSKDKGIPNMIYDPVQGKWFFTSGQNGVQDVKVTGGSIKIGALSTPTIFNLNMTTANFEYSYTLPTNTRAYAIKTRSCRPFKLAFTAGQSATNYITPQPIHWVDSKDPASPLTLYFQSHVVSDTIEVLSWT